MTSIPTLIRWGIPDAVAEIEAGIDVAAEVGHGPPVGADQFVRRLDKKAGRVPVPFEGGWRASHAGP